MGYSGAMMPQSSGFRAGAATSLAALLASVLLAGCAAQAPKAVPKDPLAVAEAALKQAQCREAAEAFVQAASASDDLRLASRATQVSLGCEQFPSAERAVARWQQLAPYAGEAALARTIIALKLYRLDEARKALTSWRDSGSAGNQDPGRFAELLESETEASAVYRVFGDVLMTDDSTADVVMAQALLALHAYDLRAALRLAERALEIESSLLPARVVIIRAQSLLGETDTALAAARELQGQLGGEDVFLVTDVLNSAHRDEQARAELLRLRADPQLAAAADRRLGAMALQQGDEAEAAKRFSGLLGQRGSTAIAMLYLAQIAERQGDDDKALQGYALLADSGVALMARGAAGQILLRQGKRAEALALIDDYLRDHPESAIEAYGARAQLLASHGDYAEVIAGLDAALLRYPEHPTLSYQRATMLERAGRHRDAEKAFEVLLRKRPDDPGILNALGFTLSDHGRGLDRAEKLVRQALAVSPDNPAIQDSLGWIHYRRGRLADAAQVLELSWRNGRDAEIGAHFGEVLWKQGSEGRARYVWQQALNMDPGNALVLATQQRLTGEAAPGRRH